MGDAASKVPVDRLSPHYFRLTTLYRVGEDVMFHLLAETSMFASLPNGCLCQLTGDPILHMRPPVLARAPVRGDDCEHEECMVRKRGTKRRCIIGYSEERPPKRQKLAVEATVDQRKLPRVEDPNRFVSKYHIRPRHRLTPGQNYSSRRRVLPRANVPLTLLVRPTYGKDPGWPSPEA